MATDELNALEQAYELSLRQMTTLLDAQARLRGVAEKRAAETRAGLERLAEALSPGLVDGLRKDDPLGTSQTPASALVDAIVRDVKRRLSRVDAAEVAGQNVEELYEGALADAARLRARAEEAEAEAAELRQWKKQMESRFAVVQQSLEDAQRRLSASSRSGDGPYGTSSQRGRGLSGTMSQPQPAEASPTALPPDSLPEWIRKWQGQDGYERDLALLRVLAETGVARREEAVRLLSERGEVDFSSKGEVRRSFQRLAKMGSIERIEVEASNSAGGTHLVRLTGQGRDASRLLGIEAAPSQATELLARHENPAHALLNLEAADLLQAAGYEVDLFPGPVELERGRTFVPDLSASRQGRTLFVDVERDLQHESHVERDQRWENYYVASGGEFYIVVLDEAAFDAVKSDVLFWAGQRPLALWMMIASDAEGKGEAIWTFKRGEPR